MLAIANIPYKLRWFWTLQWGNLYSESFNPFHGGIDASFDLDCFSGDHLLFIPWLPAAESYFDDGKLFPKV